MPLDLVRKKAYNKEYQARNRERYNAIQRDRNKKFKAVLNERQNSFNARNPHIAKLRRSRANAKANGHAPIAATAEQIKMFLESTPHVCMNTSCAKPLAGRDLVIDHCHYTGAIRGLLCNQCNLLAGKIEKNKGLVDYLRTWSTATE